MTTPDLFDTLDANPVQLYRQAFAAWRDARTLSGELRQETSVAVYEHMWVAFTQWAVGHGVPLAALRAEDLAAFLASRGRAGELSNRYALRFLRLVDRVLRHAAAQAGTPASSAVADLMRERPDWRFADAARNEDLPDSLPAGEARRLVAFLSAVRPGRRAAGSTWQEVRNRAAVGVMLGAGLTPGEVRALQCPDVHDRGGPQAGVPWKLRVAAGSQSPERDTPVARWAGRLLQHWLQVRREQAIPGDMLFPATRRTGKPWGKVAQYNATKEVLAAAGIDDLQGGSYRLRHTFALRQLRRGTSPDELARWLGVTDPGVMARYGRVLSGPVEVV